MMTREILQREHLLSELLQMFSDMNKELKVKADKYEAILISLIGEERLQQLLEDDDNVSDKTSA